MHEKSLITSGPFRCRIVLFSGSCQALWSPFWGIGSWLIYFSFVCRLCTVYNDMFASRLYSGIPEHLLYYPLRKHAFSNIKKISPPQTENFKIKKLWYFPYFCSKHRLWVLVRTASTRWSNEYPQSMLLSRNKNINVYPCKPYFYYIKVGFKGVKS